MPCDISSIHRSFIGDNHPKIGYFLNTPFISASAIATQRKRRPSTISMAKKGSTVTTSSDGRHRGKIRQSKTTTFSEHASQVGSSFDRRYLPTYFGLNGNMRQSEQEMDWNMYMSRPMSLQHRVVAKLRMFFESKFDIVILGSNQDKNRFLANMMFKCFLDPLGKEVEDHIGQAYADERAGANLLLNKDNSSNSKMVNEMLAIKEDKIRYTQINVLHVYGLGLRFHVAGSIDKSDKIASSVAQQQIHVMANYLNFKKKTKSGFGMNTFLHILDYEGKLNKVTNCMLELMVSVFTLEVLNSLIFLVESEEQDTQKKKQLEDDVKSEISQKVCCKPELVNIMSIRPLQSIEKKKAEEDLEEDFESETTVSASLKLLNEVARQTYIDPNPFEPEGMDYHDAIAAVETVRNRYQLREKDWHYIMNHVYTMIPN